MRKSVGVVLGLSLLASLACSVAESGNEGSEVEAAPEAGRALGDVPRVIADALGGPAPRVEIWVATGDSPVRECGYCWGPSAEVGFVDQWGLGPHGERCVRQIPCRQGTYAFNDGFMEQRPLVPGSYYYYRAYAFNENGLGYGDVGQFYWTGPSQATSPGVETLEVGFNRGKGAKSGAYPQHAIIYGTFDHTPETDRMTECGICWGSHPAPHLVEQSTNEPGQSLRCMRSPGCVTNVYDAGSYSDFWYSTKDGYQAQIDYVPGAVYNYVAYGVIDGAVRYGETRQFTAPPRVTTGGVQWSTFGKTLLAGSVESQGPIKECGICWGSDWPTFVDSADNGPRGDYCMRQIGCAGRSYAYWTNDGFMKKRDYDNGWNYEYVAYAIAGNGEIYYGAHKTFTAVR